MLCHSVRVLLIASVSLLALAPAERGLEAADAPGGDEWKYDVIYRKRGLPLRGLVLEQGATVKIRCISRKPGSPTVVFTENVPRGDIARLELLDDAARGNCLQHRLESLKRERDVLAAHLRLAEPQEKGAGQIRRRLRPASGRLAGRQ